MAPTTMTVDQFALLIGARWIQFCATRGVYPHIITDQERQLLRTRVAVLAAELRALRGQPSATETTTMLSAENRSLLNTVMRLDQQMDTYENGELLASVSVLSSRLAPASTHLARITSVDCEQDDAVSHIPLQDLHAAADARQAGEDPLPSFEDALAEALVKWFKPSFFKWADPITCADCSKPMASRGHAAPTPDERAGGAGVVELYACENGDGSTFRFPRYKSVRTFLCGYRYVHPVFLYADIDVRLLFAPGQLCLLQLRFSRDAHWQTHSELRALLKSRIGRCGEFANLFTLMLRAVGLRARYGQSLYCLVCAYPIFEVPLSVWNAEDHVWSVGPPHLAQNAWLTRAHHRFFARSGMHASRST